MNRESLTKYLREYAYTSERDVLSADCAILVYLLDNCDIRVVEEKFFIRTNCERMQISVIEGRRARYHSLAEPYLIEGSDACAYSGVADFGHTTTEWDSVISLGIAGLRDRIDAYLEKHRGDAKKVRFYSEIRRVYDASLNFMRRAADAALNAGKVQMHDSLMNLCEHPPRTLYEAMQTIIVYYNLQHFFECTNLRTLGRLDSLLYPFYEKEDKAVRDGLVLDFLREIDSLGADANIPFALGGTDEDGRSLVNELSYAILDAYRKAGTTNTKFHLLCSENTPRDIIENAFLAVREGNNSIVFMSDEQVIRSLEKMGESHADAVDYHVVGCYECGGRGEITCSCNGRVNIPKALELALNGGKDMLTGRLIGVECESDYTDFDALYLGFERQLSYLCDCAVKLTDTYEEHSARIHSAPILSGVYESALERGGDIYCDFSAKYNNSSINAVGLATAVDSLIAIKELVFDRKMLTLSELCDILRADWKDNEPLRLLIKNKFPKFGQGKKEVDDLARRVVDSLSENICGRSNVKGGKYRLGLFSIDWRWAFGERCAASANSRHAGDTLSQNTGASFGADTEGASAHLRSVAAIDTTRTPNGTIVDIDLHSSAVSGDNGINALVASLKAYFELGGFAVHYNVLNTDVLREARLDPDKYPNLQVRLCGWNVLFSSLSDKEKDEFIARSVK